MSVAKFTRRRRKRDALPGYVTVVQAVNMAASMRLLARRVIRLSNRNVTASAAGVLCPSCRCFSDAAEDRSTHFGFETVPEEEKAKRGERLQRQIATSCI